MKKKQKKVALAKETSHPFRFLIPFIGVIRTGIRQLFSKANLGILILILIGLAIRLHFLNQTIKYDEAFTFMRFVCLPFNKLIGYYPVPNNHILHSILVKISTISFGHWEWAIRLPVFLTGILLIVFMFMLGRKVGNRETAFWTASLTACSSGLALYSVNARGYILVCLFTAIIFFASINIRGNGGAFKDWTLFVLGSVAGLFTVPVMLFPVASLSLWLLLDINPALAGARTLIMRRLALAGVCIFAGAALCYTPLMLDSGLDSLIGNRFVKPQTLPDVLARLPEFVKSLLEFFFEELPALMQVILGVAFIIGLRRMPFLALSLVLCTLALISYQRVIPPVRALSFGLVFFILFGAVGMHSISEWIARRIRIPNHIALNMWLAIAWAVAGSFFLFRLPSLGQQNENYPEAQKVTACMTPYLDIKTDIFALIPECEILTYYLSERGLKDINVSEDSDTPQEKMLMVANLRHGSVDSIMQLYPHRFIPYNPPQQIAQIDSTVICILESIQAKGLKPGSSLEKYILDFYGKKTFSSKDFKNINAAITCLVYLNRAGTLDSLLSKILELDPDNAVALEKLGDLKISMNQHQEAEKYYLRLLKIKPAHPTALRWAGIMAGSRGDLDQARKYLLDSVQKDSTDLRSLYTLGLLYLKAGDNQNAILWLNKAMDYHPDDLNVTLALGQAYSSSEENRQKALDMYRKAQQLSPGAKDAIEKQLVEPLLKGKTINTPIP